MNELNGKVFINKTETCTLLGIAMTQAYQAGIFRLLKNHSPSDRYACFDKQEVESQKDVLMQIVSDEIKRLYQIKKKRKEEATKRVVKVTGIYEKDTEEVELQRKIKLTEKLIKLQKELKGLLS